MNIPTKIIAFSLALIIVSLANGQAPGSQGGAGNDLPGQQSGPPQGTPLTRSGETDQPVPQPPQGQPRPDGTEGQPAREQLGRFEIIKEEVRLPDRFERVWVDPVFRTAFDPCGRPVRVMVAPGHYRHVRIPGGREVRERKVWVPAPPAPVGPGAFFTLRNVRKFRVQLQSIHVALADGTTALVAPPADRVISSTKQLSFPLPENAVSVSVRFKTWDRGNRRFRFPILAAHFPLQGGDVGIIL